MKGQATNNYVRGRDLLEGTKCQVGEIDADDLYQMSGGRNRLYDLLQDVAVSVNGNPWCVSKPAETLKEQ